VFSARKTNTFVGGTIKPCFESKMEGQRQFLFFFIIILNQNSKISQNWSGECFGSFVFENAKKEKVMEKNVTKRNKLSWLRNFGLF